MAGILPPDEWTLRVLLRARKKYREKERSYRTGIQTFDKKEKVIPTTGIPFPVRTRIHSFGNSGAGGNGKLSKNKIRTGSRS